MTGKSAVIYVLGVSILMGYIMMNLASLGTRATTNVSWYHAASISKNLATIGANVGLSKIYQDPDIDDSVLASHEFNEGEYRGGRYDVYWNTNTKKLTSVSRYRNPMGGLIRDTVEVSLRPLRNNGFTVFAYMSNHEPPNIRWLSQIKIYGRLHSNSDIRVSGSPQFYGKVTTAGNFSPPPGVGTNKAYYHQGYETGVAKIELPDDLSELYAATSDGGRFYDEDEIWVELVPGTTNKNDGTAIIRTSNGGVPIDTVAIGDSNNFNGVIGGRKRVYVEGTLSGQLTITSLQEDIYISGDVRYQNQVNSVFDNQLQIHIDVVNGDDLLGLVANRNIRVKTHKSNGSFFRNPVIHASLFVLGDESYYPGDRRIESEEYPGGFGAEHYNRYGDRGEVYLLGSITQNSRSAMGRAQANRVLHGYRLEYIYDTRLRDNNTRPPKYPGFWEPTLRIVNWYESIQLPPL